MYSARVLRDCNLHRGENLSDGEGERKKRAAEVIFANITRSRESCDALRGNDSALHKKRSAWRTASRRVASRRIASLYVASAA
jgi:hypothetical protein